MPRHAAEKDPAASRRYGFLWEDLVTGDTLSTSTWTSTPSGLVLSNMTHDTTTTAVRVAGGTTGTIYTVTNTITTTQADTDEASFTLTVRDQ